MGSSRSARKVLDHSFALTIQDLIAYKILSGKDLKATWTNSIYRNDEKATDVSYYAIVTSELIYVNFKYRYNGNDCDFSHKVVRQPVNLGGYRYYFKCGCSTNGIPCGRQVKALYWGGNVFACRHCLKLVYLSSRIHRDRLEYGERARALEKKAERYRKNKHPRKANRLLWLAQDFHEEHAKRFMGELGKMMSRQ